MNGNECVEKEEEDEVEKLQNMLKIEKEERKKAVEMAEMEMEKEIRESEQKWMDKVRKLSEERDEVARKMDEFEEKIETMKRQVHRSETYKMEIEEANQRLRMQYEALQRDYEETMQERSIVLEENARLIEEKERLNKEMLNIKSTFEKHENEEIEGLKKKLEHTRRLLQVNMEETVNANAKRDAALARMNDAEHKGLQMAEERDEALRRCRQQVNCESIVDIWNTHSVEINLPFPKPNLGILLGGGRTDDGSLVHGPIYVRHVAHGSPFENLLKTLDHIMMVNDISVTDMDERSVMGMLSNSHHIHLVIRRRANCNRITDICLPLNYGVGLELANGVFINSCEPNGAAARGGLIPGQRVVHVMNTPVYDAKHAELLIKNAREPLIIGILQSTKRGEQSSKDKQKPTIFSRWFGRNGNGNASDKERNVVAKANIDGSGGGAGGANESSLFRQGSLRIPHTNASPHVSPLVRYGSLRAPTYSSPADHSKLVLDTIDKRLNGGAATTATYSEISSPSSTIAANTTSFVPNSSSIFSTPTSPVVRLIRENPEQKRTMSQISTSPRGGRAWDGRSFTSSSDTRPYSMHFTPTSSTILEDAKPSHRRSAVYSPTTSHHPPPYPSIRDDSLSSIMSSSNSIRLPSTSYYPNNSVSSLTGGSMNRHCVSKVGSDFSVSTSGSVMDRRRVPMKTANSYRSNHEALLVNRSSHPRLVDVIRDEVRLCGGNAIGILAEKSVGSDVLEGDLILEINGNSVRNTTLECAVNILNQTDNEVSRLLVQDGGDRLNRLRLGADGDSFFLRVNVDRGVESKDELELKCGDVVFVDKTMYMGKRGRWRAWKLDKEGRQRQHGAIPSSTSIHKSMAGGRFVSPVYEWVEKLDTNIRRPVLLFGALVEPFLQTLVDESDKFSQVARETLSTTMDELISLLDENILIDSQLNPDAYDSFHVISTSHVIDITAQGLHCVLHVDNSAIERLRKCRLYPIIVKIRFKSVKQLKDLNEHICGEKISSKEAKQLIEADLKSEKDLDGAVTLVVPNHNNPSFMLTHAVLQLKKLIEDEQKKTVWVQRKRDN